MGERGVRNAEVGGSSPPISTTSSILNNVIEGTSGQVAMASTIGYATWENADQVS